MDDQTSQSAPSNLTAALDASALDLLAGRVGDTAGVQREARKLLEAFENSLSGHVGTHSKTA